MGGVGGLVDFVGDALHAVFEAPVGLRRDPCQAQAASAAEQDQDDDREDASRCVGVNSSPIVILPAAGNIDSPTGTHYCRTSTI